MDVTDLHFGEGLGETYISSTQRYCYKHFAIGPGPQLLGLPLDNKALKKKIPMSEKYE